MSIWIKTNFPGVRFREHPTRRHGLRKDQYFTIRFKIDGRDKEEGLGWASEGWTAAKAYSRLCELKESQKTADGPQTFAEKRRAEKERRAAEQLEEERRKRESITFDEFFSGTYLPDARHEKKDRTVDREGSLYRLWVKPVLGSLPMKEVTAFHLERLKKNMSTAGLSKRTAVYGLCIVRQVFNKARRHGVFSGENPATKVKFPKPDNARMRFLTYPEAQNLLVLLADKSRDVHDMTLLSLHCGLRFGEIAALTWQDVDTEKGILTIRDAKAGSRYAYLTKQTSAMLQERMNGADDEKEKQKTSDLVFQGRKNQYARVSLSFSRAVEELGLNEGIVDPRYKVCFHTCRHTYASWLIDQGQDLYTVQKLLGHKTNVMTQRYAHLAESRFKNAATAMGQTLAKMDTGAGQARKKRSGIGAGIERQDDRSQGKQGA